MRSCDPSLKLRFSPLYVSCRYVISYSMYLLITAINETLEQVACFVTRLLRRSRNYATSFRKCHQLSLFIIPWKTVFLFSYVRGFAIGRENRARFLTCLSCDEGFTNARYRFHVAKMFSVDSESLGILCHMREMFSGGCCNMFETLPDNKKNALFSRVHQRNVPLAL